MSRVGVRDGAAARRATPGQMLSARAGIRAARPAEHGPGWVAASEYYTELAEVLTGRLDVHVVLAPAAAGANPPAAPGGKPVNTPGRWIPALSRIDLDGAILPVSPDALDTTDPASFAALAALHGVFVHEVGHCEHTLWKPRPTSPARAEAMALLEEIRMEARVVATRPSAPTWLRAAATHLILDELLTTPDTRWGAACLATLTAGRVAAGSLRPEDVAELTPRFEEVLGAETYAELTALWAEVVGVGDEDYDQLAALADRFRELTRPEGESGEGESGGSGTSSASGGGVAGEEDDPAADPSGAGGGDELREAVREALEAAAAAGAEDAGEETATAELADELVDAVTEALKELEGAATDAGDPGDAAGTALTAASSPREGGRGTGVGSGIPVRWSLRDALPSERAARRKIAERLRRARWRDRVSTPYASTLPPGRLRSRAALTRSAEISMGRLPTAQPWRRTRKRWVDSPNLRVAVLVDVSGSMGPYQEALSSAAWVLATGVADAAGRCEVVAFGDDAVRVAEQGKPPKQVLNFLAEASTEQIAKALRMVDRDLELANPLAGPRLVVIVSDGVWVEATESREADAHLERLRTAGCQVLLVGIRQEPQVHPADARLVLVSPDDLVPLVGEAARRSLARSG